MPRTRPHDGEGVVLEIPAAHILVEIIDSENTLRTIRNVEAAHIVEARSTVESDEWSGIEPRHQPELDGKPRDIYRRY